jgi:hypothetical protein
VVVVVAVVHPKDVQFAAADFEAMALKYMMSCTHHLSDEGARLKLEFD